MSDLRISKKEKNQHIQVFVRVRPIDTNERASKSISLVDVVSSKEVIIRERPQDKLSKKFTFDKVFGPTCKQIDVYNAVVNPLLDEVLAGYNCTVFAYGQTGTGKTFTMEGLSNDPALHWQSDSTAGIIPRALSHLFDELRTLDSQEYTVRVSFLELYNEELFDLLSPNDDASKIRLYEDASRKGAVIIHGLEEVTVHNKSEVYKILEKGSEKRQTAATLMNAHSSRSHTVFSITIHIKENTVDGEELLKTGKLNLVDLAGSENVGRSGAVDRRAREAGNINQSLLTLGRVITALVERAPHIPYRESKLTRLLQESLGGRTKTSIIATVSPASINLEETLSTLDYAYRAKNITNRPEINQKLSKKTLLKEYTEEIERLRRDLLATRERNGVYLAYDNYNEMQALLDCQSKEIEEKINHIKALEETMRKKEDLFNSLELMYRAQTNTLNKTRSALESTEITLKSAKSRLGETERERDEQKYLVEKHVSTEKVLSSQAQVLLKVADTASCDVYGLHEKINRKKQVEEENENLGQQFRGDIANRIEDIEKDFSIHTQELIQFCLTMKDQITAQASIVSKSIDTTIYHISKDLVKQVCTVSDNLTECANRSFNRYQSWTNKHVQDISCASEHESNELSNISEMQTAKIRELVENKIAENLRSLNNEISQKLEHLSAYLKESTDRICDALCVDRDRQLKDIVEIKESVQTIYQERNQSFEEQQNFSEAFNKLYDQFNELCKNKEKRCSNISAALNRVTEVCDNLNDAAITNCNETIEKERSFEENIQNNVKIITDKITSGIEENVAITERTIEQGNTIADELQTGLSSSSNAWINYKNLAECSVEHLQQDSEKEKSAIISSAQELCKIISDASVNHTEFMENQRNKTESTTTELSRKCEQQSVESAEWNNKITAQVRTAHHQIEKFLVEDLRRDVPTGYTPIKKEFKYPRQLVITSPHERIIQRFREARHRNDTTIKNEDVSVENVDSTLKAEISCTDIDATCNVNVMLTPDRNFHSTSTPITELKSKCSTLDETFDESVNNLTKAASTSDLSIVTRPSLDSSIRSKSAICLQGDKENVDREILTKSQGTKSKQFTGLKTTKRSVLGTYN